MITTGFLGFLLAVFSPIVNQFPSVDLSGLGDGASAFLPWVRLAGYMLPMSTFYSIFKIIMALMIFRIVVSFFKSLWGVLPVL